MRLDTFLKALIQNLVSVCEEEGLFVSWHISNLGSDYERSALDIISKFSEMEFARKAKVADFTVQAWEALREAGAGDGDKVCLQSSTFPTISNCIQVLDTALLVFTTLATRDVRDLVDLANRSDCVSIMFKMLEVLTLKNDTLGLINTGLSDVELKQAGIARSEKSLVCGSPLSLLSKSHRLKDCKFQ